MDFNSSFAFISVLKRFLQIFPPIAMENAFHCSENIDTFNEWMWKKMELQVENQLYWERRAKNDNHKNVISIEESVMSG